MIRNGVSIPFKRGPPALSTKGCRWKTRLPTNYASWTMSWPALWLAEHGKKANACVTSEGVRRAKLSMGQRHALRSHFLGCRVLPYMDDFRFFASSRAQGSPPFWDDCVSADTPTRASGSRLLIRRAKRDKRWLHVRELVSLAGRAQFLFLPINPARFYLREMYNVLRAKHSWSGSGYGWGAIFIETIEARGFWYDCDCELHITCKELKAVRYAMLTSRSCERMASCAQLVHPPWGLIDDHVTKLHTSGAAATVIVPYWPDRGWHQRLPEMASEVVVFPPSPDLFAPGRLGVRNGVGPPK
eukprot:jgi/Tetstr1/437786/TSEL_026440.t1